MCSALKATDVLRVVNGNWLLAFDVGCVLDRTL